MISSNFFLAIQQTVNGGRSTAAVHRQSIAAQRQLLFREVGDDASASQAPYDNLQRDFLGAVVVWSFLCV